MSIKNDDNFYAILRMFVHSENSELKKKHKLSVLSNALYTIPDIRN